MACNSKVRPGVRGAAIFLALLLTGTSIILNLVLFPLVPVVQQTSAAAAWAGITGVNVGEASVPGMGCWLLGTEDETDNCYVSAGHMHGSNIYRVSVRDMTLHLDEYIAATRLAIKDRAEGVRHYMADAFERYDKDRKPQEHDLDRLANAIDDAFAQKLLERSGLDSVLYHGMMRGIEWMRIRQAQHLWYQAVFEVLWLALLIWFLFWPAIKGMRARRWAIHAALLPMLYMLPLYLGYQQTSGTSIGPVGGGVYTRSLYVLPRQYAAGWESWVIDQMPKLLDGLNAHPGPLMAVTGVGVPGMRPLVCLIAGVVLALGAYLLARSLHRSPHDVSSTMPA